MWICIQGTHCSRVLPASSWPDCFMRGMAPGENKFHREIAKTEFSQRGHEDRGYFTARPQRPQRPQRSDNLKTGEKGGNRGRKTTDGLVSFEGILRLLLLPHVKIIRLRGLCSLAVRIVSAFRLLLWRRQVAVKHIGNRSPLTILSAPIDHQVLTFIVDLRSG